MVHITNTIAQDGEGIHAQLLNEVVKIATQNERQKRSRAHQKSNLQNVVHNAMPNGEQNLPTTTIDLVFKNPTLNLEKSTTRNAKRFAIEWFRVTFSEGVEYQWMFLQKILKNPIWHDVLLNLKDLENAQTQYNFLKRMAIC
jgi:hypothetical protein